MTDALRARPSALIEADRLHRLGVEATALGRPAEAARHLRKALRLLGVPLGARPVAAWESAPSPEGDVIAARILTSLAHAEAEQGRTSLGFALLVRCEPLVAPADRGKFFGQRGLLLLRTGRARAALGDFDLAVGLIDADREPVELARVLLNRTVARMETGAFAGARSDSERCLELARAADRPLLAVKALHNLGCCDLVVGDVPAALRTIGEAADGFAALSPSWRPVAVVDIARALLLAGLATDAAAELDTAIGLFRGQRMSQDRAEAEAVRAEASLLAGDAGAAREWARSARAGFRRRGNASGAAAAELIALQAAYQLTVLSQSRRSAGVAGSGAGSGAGSARGQCSRRCCEHRDGGCRRIGYRHVAGSTRGPRLRSGRPPPRVGPGPRRDSRRTARHQSTRRCRPRHRGLWSRTNAQDSRQSRPARCTNAAIPDPRGAVVSGRRAGNGFTDTPLRPGRPVTSPFAAGQRRPPDRHRGARRRGRGGGPGPEPGGWQGRRGLQLVGAVPGAGVVSPSFPPPIPRRSRRRPA